MKVKIEEKWDSVFFVERNGSKTFRENSSIFVDFFCISLSFEFMSKGQDNE